jgi:hypothetical protein
VDLMLDKVKIMKEHARILKKELTDITLHPRIWVCSEKGWERIEMKIFFRKFLPDTEMDWIFTILHWLGYHKEIWFTFLPAKRGVWLHIIIRWNT